MTLRGFESALPRRCSQARQCVTLGVQREVRTWEGEFSWKCMKQLGSYRKPERQHVDILRKKGKGETRPSGVPNVDGGEEISSSEAGLHLVLSALFDLALDPLQRWCRGRTKPKTSLPAEKKQAREYRWQGYLVDGKSDGKEFCGKFPTCGDPSRSVASPSI